MDEARWYVVHTYSGYENKVKTNIEMAIKNRNLQEQILEVRVPTHESKELRTKKTKAGEEQVWTSVERKLFPGYVLVNMVLTNETWFVVRNIRGVTGFVGPESKPTPLSELEMFNLGIQSSNMDVDVESEIKVGDTVRLISSMWNQDTAQVTAVNARKRTITITMETMGQQVPVELSFSEVRKM